MTNSRSTLENIRRELVALKRSIDPHLTDPRRYEILRDDLDPIWGRLEALLHDDEVVDAIPSNVRQWITGMVNGETTVKIGHMMFSTDENFRTESFEEGLNLIRTCGPVEKWLREECITAEERKSRLDAIRTFAADAIRDATIATFDTADYPGD